MNIAICDDFEQDSELLNKYITEYGEKRRLDFKIFCFLSGEALLEDIEKYNFEIVFMDIYLGGKSGIETAHAIRALVKDCLIIFTTTSLDHAIESFEVSAIHYLVKPLSYERVEKALERCRQLFALEHKYVEIKSERIMVRVYLNDLIFAEVFGNITVLHTASDEIRTYMSLDELVLLLDCKEILRCHRSFIVNMNFVSGVESCDFLLKSGQKIPFRRQDKQQMKQCYSDYLFGAIRRQGDV